MEDKLNTLLAIGYATLGSIILLATGAAAWADAVIRISRGGDAPPMPKVNLFQFLGIMLERLVKSPRRRKYSMTTKKLVNLGEVNPIPEVPPELERWMARELLRELDGGKMVDEVSLSVSTWKGRWTGTQEQFAALMDKWQEEGIVYRKNKRGDRAFVQPSRPSIRARMKAKI